MNKNTIKENEALKGKLIAVEIEFYPINREAISTLTASIDSNNACEDRGHIEIDTDGSLHPTSDGRVGREVKVLTWVNADGRIEDVLRLKLNGNITKDCGLHVHVDARHLGQNGLLTADETYERLVKMYRRVFKKLVPQSRKNCRWCRWTNNRLRYGYNKRYAAINFHSFRKHGTIEFRMQGGSINVEKIEKWILLCQFALNYVANPANEVPTTWSQFLRVLPRDLRAWSIDRRATMQQLAAQSAPVALAA